MDLDPESCWRAVRARDARFDGRFVTGVLSTGVYCRPVCPARTPARERCRFFAHPAAAEEAGFRACLRCRPDAAPGSAAWRGTSVTVARALRLIDEGALDEGSLDALAARLGMGARHLRRLMQDEVGASPRSLALTRRVHFARQLLEATDLPVTRVALASGFGSLRRFHDAFRRSFGRAPTMLRRSRHPSREGLTLRLSVRTPFDGDSLLAFLAPRATPGIEEVRDGVYRRATEHGLVLVRPRETHLEVTAPEGATRGLLDLTKRVRRLFDADADALAIREHLSRDRLLAPLVRARPGLRVPGAWSGFELAARTILGQQVSVAAATTLAGRVVARVGSLTPEELSRANLDGLGITSIRVRALRALAEAVLAGELLLDGSGDPDATRERLLRLPGVGPWTASAIAMRALSDPDAFPAADLVLRKAAGRGKLITPRALESRSRAWRPFRAYAALHLWHSEANR